MRHVEDEGAAVAGAARGDKAMGDAAAGKRVEQQNRALRRAHGREDAHGDARRRGREDDGVPTGIRARFDRRA